MFPSLESPCVHAKSLQLCPTRFHPMDFSPPGSSVHGFLQERILAWVAMPSSRGSSWPRDRTRAFCLAGGFFTGEPPGKRIVQPEKEIMNPFQMDFFSCFTYRPLWSRLTTTKSTFLAYLSLLWPKNRNTSFEVRGISYASLWFIGFYRYGIRNKWKIKFRAGRRAFRVQLRDAVQALWLWTSCSVTQTCYFKCRMMIICIRRLMSEVNGVCKKSRSIAWLVGSAEERATLTWMLNMRSVSQQTKLRPSLYWGSRQPPLLEVTQRGKAWGPGCSRWTQALLSLTRRWKVGCWIPKSSSFLTCPCREQAYLLVT